MSTHGDLLRQVEDLAASASDTKTLMQRIADHVHSVMPRYNSISFRLLEQGDAGMLILGPYTGSFTPQLRIPLGKGLCGAAATTEKTIVVNDVANDHRYVLASSMVKSEIVVPILIRGKFAAIIDVQSYFADTFKDPNDRSFGESCAGVVAKFMEAHAKRKGGS